MAILVIRNDGSVIEMPDGPAHFQAQLRHKNKAKAVDKRLGRTYQVKSTQDGFHITEQSHAKKSAEPPVLIRPAKLLMNK